MLYLHFFKYGTELLNPFAQDFSVAASPNTVPTLILKPVTQACLEIHVIILFKCCICNFPCEFWSHRPSRIHDWRTRVHV
jgi:hypothetical protein